MNSAKVFWSGLGLFAGGAVVGMLFAPAQGKHTRKKIVNTTADYMNELKSKADDLMENITETIDIVKDEADKLTRKLKR